jgi:hypothetical protein
MLKNDKYVPLSCTINAHPQAMAEAHKYVRESGHVALLMTADTEIGKMNFLEHRNLQPPPNPFAY